MTKLSESELQEGARNLVARDPAHKTRVLYTTRRGELRYGTEEWFLNAGRRRGILVARVRWLGANGVKVE